MQKPWLQKHIVKLTSAFLMLPQLLASISKCYGHTGVCPRKIKLSLRNIFWVVCANRKFHNIDSIFWLLGIILPLWHALLVEFLHNFLHNFFNLTFSPRKNNNILNVWLLVVWCTKRMRLIWAGSSLSKPMFCIELFFLYPWLARLAGGTINLITILYCNERGV